MSDTIKNAEEMLKHLAEFSKDCFDKNGEVMPMWIIVSDKEIIPVITQFSGAPGEKQELFKFIQAKAKEVDAHVVGFMAEAWSVQRTAEDEARNVVPSECDDRIEIVQVIAEDRKGNHRMGHYVINRDKDDNATLGPFDEFDTKGAQIEGIFVGSLEKLNG